MTLPIEERNAILRTEKFLEWLLWSTKKERQSMPQSEFRQRVSACLRHYPYSHRVEQLFDNEAKTVDEEERKILYGETQ